MCSNEECERFVNQENEEYKSSPFCEADFADIGDIIESEPEKVLRRLNETTRDSRRCPKCKTHLRKRYALLGNQGFFFYPLLHYTSTDFPESGLPLTQKIQNKMYTVFAYTVIRGDLGPTYGPEKRIGLPHFLTVFVYNNKRIVFDGLLNKAYMSSKPQYEWKVTSVWLVPQKN
ncbi:unnamed protein product [Orchesella dallaii]|uniref:Uncharacterized protein n=1 Tax=Orchesella dallaii TaxID=48710 RepID=A0ABP1RZU8_9HEXA